MIDRLALPSIIANCRRRFPGLRIVVRDHRLCRATRRGRRIVEQRVDEARLADYVEVDLAEDSLLAPLNARGRRFGIVDYPHKRLNRVHSQIANRYLIHRDFLDASAFINLPKMKCHMKSGTTRT